MSASRIISALCHLSANNYQNWWKFDKVLTKTILHSFFETQCTKVWTLCYNTAYTSQTDDQQHFTSGTGS